MRLIDKNCHRHRRCAALSAFGIAELLRARGARVALLESRRGRAIAAAGQIGGKCRGAALRRMADFADVDAP